MTQTPGAINCVLAGPWERWGKDLSDAFNGPATAKVDKEKERLWPWSRYSYPVDQEYENRKKTFFENLYALRKDAYSLWAAACFDDHFPQGPDGVADCDGPRDLLDEHDLFSNQLEKPLSRLDDREKLPCGLPKYRFLHITNLGKSWNVRTAEHDVLGTAMFLSERKMHPLLVELARIWVQKFYLEIRRLEEQEILRRIRRETTYFTPEKFEGFAHLNFNEFNSMRCFCRDVAKEIHGDGYNLSLIHI